jgi:hypothetical protein
MKYNVGITVNAPISTVVEVEAASEEEAEEKARALVLEGEHYRVKDFDGNSLDILDDDLNVDSIDRGAP